MKTQITISCEYSINITADACTGDEVAFKQAIFNGFFRRPKFAGTRMVMGKIISDSYGRFKQQHVSSGKTRLCDWKFWRKNTNAENSPAKPVKKGSAANKQHQTPNIV